MFTPKILIKRRFAIKDVQIELTDGTNRAVDESFHDAINASREELVEHNKTKGKNIWDGTFYRVENSNDLNNATNDITLKLNTIKYRYIATATQFMDYYKENPERHTNHLSTAAMIETADGFYVFGRRSGSNKIDPIGGGAQPEELEIKNGTNLEQNLRKEMLEEAGIDTHHIHSLEGIGFVYSYKSNIILIGHTKLQLTKEQLDQVFLSRTDDEMDKLLYVPKNEITTYMAPMNSYRPLLPSLL